MKAPPFGSWRWFNTDLSLTERVAFLFSCGRSVEQCRIAMPEASVSMIYKAWRLAYHSRRGLGLGNLPANSARVALRCSTSGRIATPSASCIATGMGGAPR